jgi:hypothetical protein
MAEHPYRNLPPKSRWSQSVGRPAPADVDPVGAIDLRISERTKVATAGSCFAQHIARHLRGSGFNYYVPETAHPTMPAVVAQSHNYGMFSARYGNIYTSRQLLQLVRRAYGVFTPTEAVWPGPDGRGFVDPFRPSIQPGGYVSEAELHADRAWHLAKVREMLENLDVFVFTLGLTECWMSRADGAVYPICPGVDGGEFDPAKYKFHNLDVDEVVADMTQFADHLRAVNPNAQILLTVSPVPLAATAEPGEHVLTATTYSKSVLRVAAGVLKKRLPNVHYFPSYEIITGAYNRGAYYAPNLRDVLEDGVSHVMRLFMQHVTVTGAGELAAPSKADASTGASNFIERVERWAEVMCDEEKLDLD